MSSPKKAKKNPQDATIRNVRSADRRLEKLESFAKLMRSLRIPQRLTALERRAK